MPQFYEQRPVRLRPKTPTRIPAKASTRVLAGLPAEPRHGFGGRASELLRIERWLRRGKAVVIHGFGGAGKTTLAREAAIWLTRTGLYVGACYVSLAAGGDAATVPAALGRLLGVKAELSALRRKLATKPVLVIIDDLEAILPGGDAPLDPAGRTALWDALLDLSAAGAGLLLVTRDLSFGDGRLAHGGLAAHLELAGLLLDEAVELAGRLLDDLGIDRKAIDFSDLSGLLENLGGLPLAIQLVLPSLREMPARSLRDGFDVLLHRFVDPDEPGRNGSLAASLEASLRRLTAAERSALTRLAPFECGVFEDDLLAVTGLDGDSWSALSIAPGAGRSGPAGAGRRGGLRFVSPAPPGLARVPPGSTRRRRRPCPCGLRVTLPRPGRRPARPRHDRPDPGPSPHARRPAEHAPGASLADRRGGPGRCRGDAGSPRPVPLALRPRAGTGFIRAADRDSWRSGVL